MKSKILTMVAIWMVASAPLMTSWVTAVERMASLIVGYVFLTMADWEKKE